MPNIRFLCVHLVSMRLQDTSTCLCHDLIIVIIVALLHREVIHFEYLLYLILSCTTWLSITQRGSRTLGCGALKNLRKAKFTEIESITKRGSVTRAVWYWGHSLLGRTQECKRLESQSVFCPIFWSSVATKLESHVGIGKTKRIKKRMNRKDLNNLINSFSERANACKCSVKDQRHQKSMEKPFSLLQLCFELLRGHSKRCRLPVVPGTFASKWTHRFANWCIYLYSIFIDYVCLVIYLSPHFLY